MIVRERRVIRQNHVQECIESFSDWDGIGGEATVELHDRHVPISTALHLCASDEEGAEMRYP